MTRFKRWVDGRKPTGAARPLVTAGRTCLCNTWSACWASPGIVLNKNAVAQTTVASPDGILRENNRRSSPTWRSGFMAQFTLLKGAVSAPEDTAALVSAKRHATVCDRRQCEYIRERGATFEAMTRLKQLATRQLCCPARSCSSPGSCIDSDYRGGPTRTGSK